MSLFSSAVSDARLSHYLLLVLHLAPLSGLATVQPTPFMVALRAIADFDVAVVGADDTRRPRDVVWPDPLRRLAAELRGAEDAIDAGADFGAWVVPL